jgi:hypothetical protein
MALVRVVMDLSFSAAEQQFQDHVWQFARGSPLDPPGGVKAVVPHAEAADSFLVSARSPAGLTLFLVPRAVQRSDHTV